MKILKDSAVYLLGELFAKALPFLLLPYLTRKLGAAGFGELSYYQTVLSLLALAFGLSQDGAITRYFYFYGKRNLPNVLRTGGLYALALTLLGLLFAWWQQSWILGFVVLTAGSQTLLGSQLAWRQCQKRALSYVAIQISSSALSTVLTVLLLECTAYQPVAMRFAALCSVNFAVAAAAYCWANQKQPAHFTRRRALHSLRYILAFGLPLLLHHASGFVKGQLDRIIIYRMYSAAELGVYAAALQLAGILSIVLMAVNKATVPYSRHRAEKTHRPPRPPLGMDRLLRRTAVRRRRLVHARILVRVVFRGAIHWRAPLYRPLHLGLRTHHPLLPAGQLPVLFRRKFADFQHFPIVRRHLPADSVRRRAPGHGMAAVGDGGRQPRHFADSVLFRAPKRRRLAQWIIKRPKIR